ncbi:MAG: DUF2950 domain-containing protein [Deltaproteobacteria bacterium]
MVLYLNEGTRDSWCKRFGALAVAAVLLALLCFGSAYAQTVKQRTFASPDEAAKAMVEALKANDVKALEAVLGAGSKDLISSGDPVADQAVREQFVKKYEEKNRLEQTGDKAVLSVGNDDWPSPIPIVKKDGLWRFDAKAGREEMLARRIGQNEWSTIQFCLAYVDAQREYASKDRDGDGLLEYAQKFGSDKGKKNGLFWKVKEGEEQSPLGPLAVAAYEKGYRKKGDRPQPFFGYYYRVLTGQGKNAAGGAYDYLVRGNMIGGFALVAHPAKYGSSGVMTFIVNHDGVVYQKDLGRNTEQAAQAIKAFDPDSTWKKVD